MRARILPILIIILIITIIILLLLLLLLLLIIICQILPDRNLAPSPLLSFINNSQSLFFIFIATFIFKIFIFFLGFLGFNESRIVRNFTVISRFILYRYFCLAIHLLILWVQHRAGSVTSIFSKFDLIKQDFPSPRELGRFKLPHAAFIEVYDTDDGEKNMYLTSFNKFISFISMSTLYLLNFLRYPSIFDVIKFFNHLIFIILKCLVMSTEK